MASSVGLGTAVTAALFTSFTAASTARSGDYVRDLKHNDYASLLFKPSEDLLFAKPAT